MTWEILSTRHSREHVIADLQASDGTRKTVYLTAGILAACGLTGAPLYDGKVKR